MYREVNKYEEMYLKSEQKANKYKKRLERLKRRETKNGQELTPKSKINKLLKEKNIDDEGIRKRWLFGEVVGLSISKHYSQIKSLKEKQQFRTFMCDKIIKKYKVATMTKKMFHFHATKCFIFTQQGKLLQKQLKETFMKQKKISNQKFP